MKGVNEMGIVTPTTDKYQECIDECNKCAQACNNALRHVSMSQI